MLTAARIIQEALRTGKTALSEHDSKRLLSAYGLPVVRETLVRDPGKARAAAAELGYPVALKACDAGLTHKTEHGLVELDIAGAAQLDRATTRLRSRAPAGAGLLLQEMVPGRRELIVGLLRDPGLGPVVMLGLGGIFAEVLADVSFRLAPLTAADTADMANELAGSKLLGPVRGMPAVDREALAAWLIGIGEIGLQHPEIQQLDVNPLIVRDGQHAGQLVAVDALIVLAPEAVPGAETESVRHDRPTRITGPTARVRREQAPLPVARGSLEPLFAPRSIAVIGASATPGKAGYEVLRNLEAQGYTGTVHPVNPRGGEILGRRVIAAIADLPAGVDLAVIVLPASSTPQAVRELGRRGVKAVILAAGGFAEAGDSGLALQTELEQAIQEAGVRALGPNTAGHVSTPSRCATSFFSLGQVRRGPVSYIAQTGNFATHTLRYILTSEHFGVARVVGVGNKIDIDESEVLEYLAADPETQVICAYLESLRQPRRFLEAARAVTPHKPLVMLKGGATAAGAQAAAAHTAALATDDRVLDGVLRQAGVVRIHEYSQLITAAKGLASMPLPQGNRVGFAAPSGGMLVCLSDLCRRDLNLEVPELAETTRQRLQDLSPPLVRLRNPVDIWPAVSQHGLERAYGEATEALLGDPNTDAVVIILMLVEQTGFPCLEFLVELAGRQADKPLYVSCSGDQPLMAAAKAYLEPRGVPTFSRIEEPFRVLDIAWRCRQAQLRAGQEQPRSRATTRELQ